MNSRTLTLTFLAISILGFLASLALKNSIELGLCLVSEPTCINTLTDVGGALFLGMGALAVTLFVLLLVPRAFSAWWKFAIWYVPLAVIVFATIPEPHGWMSIIPTPDSIYRWVSGIYLVASLVIIGLAARRKG